MAPATRSDPFPRACTGMLSLALLSAACSEDPPPPGERGDLNSLLWVQTAAEYRATCRQTFAAAHSALRRALHDDAWTAALEQTADAANLPPAILVDVDETVLDNSVYNARMLVDPTQPTFDIDTWNAWVAEGRAPAIPGATEFLRAVAQDGVTIFYVTNRGHEVEQATRDNLTAVGFPLPDDNSIDVVLTRNDHDDAGSEKTLRREHVAQTHRILLMLGDDLGDFIPFSRDKSPDDRAELVTRYASFWGERWFVLPNPIYGSWLRALEPDPLAHLETTPKPGPR